MLRSQNLQNTNESIKQIFVVESLKAFQVLTTHPQSEAQKGLFLLHKRMEWFPQ